MSQGDGGEAKTPLDARAARLAAQQNSLHMELCKDWLFGISRQRRKVFEWLCDHTGLQYDSGEKEIDKIKSSILKNNDIDGLEDRDVKWSGDISGRHLHEAIRGHAEKCKFYIALIDIRLQHFTGERNCNLVLRLPVDEKDVSNKLTLLMPKISGYMAGAHHHLAAIDLLERRVRYLHDRKRGNVKKNFKPTKKENKVLVSALVKGFYKKKPPQDKNLSIDKMANDYTQMVLDLWKEWSFFYLDEDSLYQDVYDVLEPLNKKPPKVNREPYARRIHATMRRPLSNTQELSLVHPAKAHQDAAIQYQTGVQDALKVAMEARFGELSQVVVDTIFSNSPAQVLDVWFTHLHEAETAESLLNISSK